MSKKIQIKGLALLKDPPEPCFGEIEILKQENNIVYASWKLFDARGNLLASISRNYFIESSEVTDEKILPLIIPNILAYRVGRAKKFSEMKVNEFQDNPNGTKLIHDVMSKLYNNKSFPEKIFSEDISDWVFLSFDEVFREDVLSKLKEFCLNIGCKNIFVKNIEPSEYKFFEETTVSNMPEELHQLVSLEQVTDYINAPMSFAQLVEEGIIYGDETPSVFCLYLIRDYTLAILGAKGVNVKEEFKEFKIEDLSEFLTMTFVERKPTEEFYKIVKEKWNIK